MTRKEELLKFIKDNISDGDELLLPRYKTDTLETIRDRVIIDGKETFETFITNNYDDNLNWNNERIIAWRKAND